MDEKEYVKEGLEYIVKCVKTLKESIRIDCIEYRKYVYVDKEGKFSLYQSGGTKQKDIVEIKQDEVEKIIRIRSLMNKVDHCKNMLYDYKLTLKNGIPKFEE